MRHESSLLNFITCATSAVFILLAIIWEGTAESIAPWVVVMSVLVLGIPHGAIDHIMAAEIFNLKKTLKDHLLFYSSYLLIMLLVGALWIFYPVAGMIFFLIISIYHFGQADIEEFITKRSSIRHLYYIARGGLIIGLIVFAKPETTYPIMAEAMRVDVASFSASIPHSLTMMMGTIALYFLIITAAFSVRHIENPAKILIDSILLSLVLIITGPLIGFAIYFALWHSIGHIHEMQEFFKSKGKSLSLAGFYKQATPFTLVSIVGLVILVGIQNAFGLEEQFLSLMFILISVLTLPHMVIVDKMYRAGNQK